MMFQRRHDCDRTNIYFVTLPNITQFGLRKSRFIHVLQIIISPHRDQLGKMRLILQRGLETIRLLGNCHGGVHVTSMVQLARTWESRVQESRDDARDVLSLANEIASLQARATAYWKASVEALQRMIRYG